MANAQLVQRLHVKTDDVGFYKLSDTFKNIHISQLRVEVYSGSAKFKVSYSPPGRLVFTHGADGFNVGNIGVMIELWRDNYGSPQHKSPEEPSSV